MDNYCYSFQDRKFFDLQIYYEYIRDVHISKILNFDHLCKKKTPTAVEFSHFFSKYCISLDIKVYCLSIQSRQMDYEYC